MIPLLTSIWQCPGILQAIGMIFWIGRGISGDSVLQLIITLIIVAAKQETDVVVISLQMSIIAGMQ